MPGMESHGEQKKRSTEHAGTGTKGYLSRQSSKELIFAQKIIYMTTNHLGGGGGGGGGTLEQVEAKWLLYYYCGVI